MNPPQEQKKDVKQDILSLFSAPASTPQYGQMGNQAAYWGGAALPQQQQQTTGMIGMNGTQMWGTTSGWAAPAQANVWGGPQIAAPQQQSSLFNSTAAWGATPTLAMPDLSTTSTVQKDDVFEDIWGGYK